MIPPSCKKAAAAFVCGAAFLATSLTPAAAGHWSTPRNPDRYCPPGMVERVMTVTWRSPDAGRVVVGPTWTTRQYKYCTWRIR